MRFFKKLLPLLLIVAMLMSFVSCDGGEEEKKDPNLFTVTVKNPLGKPLSGVTVYVHMDGGQDYNICTLPVSTDAYGKASFTLDSANSYSVQLANLPPVYTSLSGYTPAERYAFDSNDITVTVDVNEGYVPEFYRIGDPMANFTLTDIDGNTHELYEILKEKKVVLLNFWFYGCGPCAVEFPALNAAYKNYAEVAEVLAINDYPNENESHVEGYESYRGFTLDMPLFKAEYGSEVSLDRFPAGAYPTTVVIDRYGMVSLIHTGAVTSVAKWEELFRHYTSDSYNGEAYEGF